MTINGFVVLTGSAMLAVGVPDAGHAQASQTKDYRPLKSEEYRPYKKAGFFLSNGGYIEKQKGPTRWYVRVVSREIRGQQIAVYRSAILAKRAGFRYIQIVKTHDVIESGYMRPPTQFTQIESIGAKSAAEPLTCENGKKTASACRTLPVDLIIQEASAALGRDNAQVQQDIAGD